MTELHLSLRHTGQGHAIEGEAPNGVHIAFDGEGGRAGATPMQHLLAAAGACALMDVAAILSKKRIAFRDLRVECAGERPDEGHPKPFRSMRLDFRVGGEVPVKAFEDAVRLAMEKYCNVGATLRASPTIAYGAAVEATPTT